MVWDGISGMDKAAHIAREGHITAPQYITDVLKPVIVLREENHGARVTIEHLEIEDVTCRRALRI